MTLPSGLVIRSSNLYPPLPTFGPTLLSSLLWLCLLSGCAEPDTGPNAKPDTFSHTSADTVSFTISHTESYSSTTFFRRSRR